MGSLAHPRTFQTSATNPRKKALVVMEDAGIGAAVTDLLYELDYDAWAVTGASMALTLSAEIAFQLTLTDVALTGGMDGVNLAAELRGRHQDMGIIILVDPFDSIPEGIQEFVTFRKPRPKLGARYEPLRFRFH